MKRILLIFAVFFVTVAGIYYWRQTHIQTTSDSISTPCVTTPSATKPEPTEPPLLPSNLESITTNNVTVPLDVVPGSYTALVSRDYLLPSTYVPKDLVEISVRFSSNSHDDKRKMRRVASKALSKMFRAAEKKGIILYGVSGYRSYERQKSIYSRNVALHGKKATDSLSAKPGSSEHQTGLTIDVSSSSVDCLLTERFGSTKEGRWLAKNAHKYGYIIRYPKEKTKLTGYSYEPWHIRYVGVSYASYLKKNKLTLEELYGVNQKADENTPKVDVENPDEYETSPPSPAPNQ